MKTGLGDFALLLDDVTLDMKLMAKHIEQLLEQMENVLGKTEITRALDNIQDHLKAYSMQLRDAWALEENQRLQEAKANVGGILKTLLDKREQEPK